jgi:hypothetical protein
MHGDPVGIALGESVGTLGFALGFAEGDLDGNGLGEVVGLAVTGAAVGSRWISRCSKVPGADPLNVTTSGMLEYPCRGSFVSGIVHSVIDATMVRLGYIVLETIQVISGRTCSLGNFSGQGKCQNTVDLHSMISLISSLFGQFNP